MSYYTSLKATAGSRFTCFRYWGHFHILEKLKASLRRVFSAIWGEKLGWLRHCNQTLLGTQFSVEIQLLSVTFGPKINSSNAVINIGWMKLFS